MRGPAGCGSLACRARAAAPHAFARVPAAARAATIGRTPRAGAAMTAERGGEGTGVATATRRALLSLALLAPAAALASGGATAGKFTSIPTAKRRYYGRVQEAVYEFLRLDPASAEAPPEAIDEFFGENILVKKGRVRTNCIGGDAICVSKERKTSRWDDMQLTMFLLGNAFRIDSSKSPDRIKQVQMARGFFKEVNLFKDSVAQSNEQAAKEHFKVARGLLDAYLDQVDLPPTSYDVYKTPFDESSRKLCAGGNFCI